MACLLFSTMPFGAALGGERADPNVTAPKPTTQPAVVGTFRQAEASVEQQLQESLAELARLREEIAKEKIPLGQKLSDLENQLLEVRREHQQTTRLLDGRALDLSNLRTEIQSRHEEKTYLSNLLGEYICNFETRLHIAEIQRYREPLEGAKLAMENSSLSETEVYQSQAALVTASLERLHDALGGTCFEGSAVDASGLVKRGTFVVIGPAALFRSTDGQSIGTAEQRLGSLEPTVIGFESEGMAEATGALVSDAAGSFPLDPTLGNAHKVEAMKETLREHILKGGPVMAPILGVAGLALLVALFKWLQLARVRKPAEKRIFALLHAVAGHNPKDDIRNKAKAIGGPIGEMLLAGVEHIEEPSSLIEEVMYERVLAAKLKLQHLLPFVAITASCAPLLGLLGTVTGIITTFKLITVYGSGDPKMLSSGISEALITTEYGLYVAIPSLLIHAMLSRKARGVVDQMEKAATGFINQVSKTPYRQDDSAGMLAQMPAAVAREVARTLGRQPQPEIHSIEQYSEDSAGGMMDPTVVTVGKTATVAEAIGKIRAAGIDEDLHAIFVVDDRGKYVGDVPIRLLLTRPEHASIESLVDADTMFVRVDADRERVRTLLREHDLTAMPVLDHDDRLVGRILRNGE
ncbi:MAG: MotA/TolQ/ExbB proton channel family protein [Phycisphaerales bacterium]